MTHSFPAEAALHLSGSGCHPCYLSVGCDFSPFPPSLKEISEARCDRMGRKAKAAGPSEEKGPRPMGPSQVENCGTGNSWDGGGHHSLGAVHL